MNEIERLEKEEMYDIPSSGLTITITLSGIDGKKLLKEIKNFVSSLLKIESLIDPSDRTWEEHLPNWFVKKTKDISYEDLLRNHQLWDFGSWIDAIKRREWKWWGYKLNNIELVIFLETLSIPYNIDPFFYILYSCGVDIDMTRIVETYPDSDLLKVSK